MQGFRFAILSLLYVIVFTTARTASSSSSTHQDERFPVCLASNSESKADDLVCTQESASCSSIPSSPTHQYESFPECQALNSESNYANDIVYTKENASHSSIPSSSTQQDENFLECLAFNSDSNVVDLVYTQENPSYSSVLHSSIQNRRLATPTTPKPQFIVTPTHESQVQAAVICSKKHGLQIRVRSGGHDFDGLSYTSNQGHPFLVIDLVNLRKIDVNIEDNTAWVEAGATLGEVYYRIAEKSPVHGFPGGMCPTVGVGGHVSGAGFGSLLRKYGVTADHVVDARLVNANGEILINRESMGEDLFWAIRGGGAASFGIILALKIRLVPVPPILTISFIERTLEQGATELVYKWQSIASTAPDDLYIGLLVTPVMYDTTTSSNKELGARRTVLVIFHVMFLGRAEKLLQVMEEKFPELGMKEKDCHEMSWIEAAVSFSGNPSGTPLEVLINRTHNLFEGTFKGKSDFVTEPIPKTGLEGLWKKFLEEEKGEMMIGPWGGRMNEISEHEIAFPHRAGYLYLINYMTYWDATKEGPEEHINWIRELYTYMSPYVSKSPRVAYLNFRDLDLGQNKIIKSTASYEEARSTWGHKYFNGNFEKLAQVKSRVDPDDFFSYEQSIPSIASRRKEDNNNNARVIH